MVRPPRNRQGSFRDATTPGAGYAVGSLALASPGGLRFLARAYGPSLDCAGVPGRGRSGRRDGPASEENSDG